MKKTLFLLLLIFMLVGCVSVRPSQEVEITNHKLKNGIIGNFDVFRNQEDMIFIRGHFVIQGEHGGNVEKFRSYGGRMGYSRELTAPNYVIYAGYDPQTQYVVLMFFKGQAKVISTPSYFGNIYMGNINEVKGLPDTHDAGMPCWTRSPLERLSDTENSCYKIRNTLKTEGDYGITAFYTTKLIKADTEVRKVFENAYKGSISSEHIIRLVNSEPVELLTNKSRTPYANILSLLLQFRQQRR